MNRKSLVICEIYVDEDNFNDMSIFDDISNLKQVTDIETEESYLAFLENGEQREYSLESVEWFRYVPFDSHLAKYVRNSDKYECEWDDEGQKI